MIYYLLANNNEIQNHHIEKIDYDENNILILFNYRLPMKFDKVRGHNNKYLVCRLRSDFQEQENSVVYAGMENIENDYGKFAKIFMCPYNINIAKPIEQMYNISIHHMEPLVDNLKTLTRYPRFKNMSTGFMAYNYVKLIKNIDDSIVLVGFTSQINKHYHNPSWEAKFFREEVSNKSCEIIW